jgi:predicted HAD superfamily Cof-like phosphohydrolase
MQDIIEKAFNEVHASNMSKLDNDGKPIINGLNGVLDNTRPIGKVLKSNNFFEPDLKQLINN